jgi:hypothetical protein
MLLFITFAAAGRVVPTVVLPTQEGAKAAGLDIEAKEPLSATVATAAASVPAIKSSTVSKHVDQGLEVQEADDSLAATAAAEAAWGKKKKKYDVKQYGKPLPGDVAEAEGNGFEADGSSSASTEDTSSSSDTDMSDKTDKADKADKSDKSEKKGHKHHKDSTKSPRFPVRQEDDQAPSKGSKSKGKHHSTHKAAKALKKEEAKEEEEDESDASEADGETSEEQLAKLLADEVGEEVEGEGEVAAPAPVLATTAPGRCIDADVRGLVMHIWEHKWQDG